MDDINILLTNEQRYLVCPAVPHARQREGEIWKSLVEWYTDFFDSIKMNIHLEVSTQKVVKIKAYISPRADLGQVNITSSQ